jgi:ribosomal protein S18 acetylase RimI-like enzyme
MLEVFKMSNVEEAEVSIRRMTRNDIQAVLALDRKVGSGRGLLSYKDMATTDPGGPLDLSFVAEVDGKMSGFIMNRLAYLMVPFTEVCIIQGILVHPDYQKHGIASKLLQRLLEHCQTEGINTIRALVPERDEVLRHFVERHGFRRSNIVNFDKTFDN